MSVFALVGLDSFVATNP